MNSPYEVIIRPIVSERAFDLMEQGKYTFEVARNAGKEEIAAAVEKLFSVHVTKVNTLSVKPKNKRVRYQQAGKTRQWRRLLLPSLLVRLSRSSVITLLSKVFLPCLF